MKNRTQGFSMVELLMVITLVGVLTGVSVTMYNSTLDDARFDATYKEMLQLRKALIGDLENTNVEGERIRFGYIGDMGQIPTNSQGLSALLSIPSGLSIWAINSTGKLGVGWNGPYIVSSDNTDFSKDAWGRNYVYSSSTATPYILSYGSDGAPGGTGPAQDIQLDLPLSLRTANVHGQITQSGSVYEGTAFVTIYYPGSAGAVASQTMSLATSNTGTFSFSSVPFGVRTLKIQIPNATAPQITLGPVTFPIDNQQYVIPANLLEVNPLMSDSNCNTIANISYIEDSFVNDTARKKVHFKLKVNRSFATRTFYTNNSIAESGADSRLEKFSIGGVTYGCTGIINLVFFGGGSDGRGFTNCDTVSIFGFPFNAGYVDIEETNNISLGSTWGIPAKDEVDAYMQFYSNNTTTGMNWVDLTLGCDQMRID